MDSDYSEVRRLRRADEHMRKPASIVPEHVWEHVGWSPPLASGRDSRGHAESVGAESALAGIHSRVWSIAEPLREIQYFAELPMTELDARVLGAGIERKGCIFGAVCDRRQPNRERSPFT